MTHFFSKSLLLVFVSIFSTHTLQCEQQPNITAVPKNLAEIKSKQVAKLAGLTTTKNKTLQQKEKREFLKLEKWFSKTLKTEDSLVKLCAAAFVVGLLTSLTPCIYPMIPVTAGILSSGAHHGVIHQAMRSLLYVLGIATVHSGLGYFAATTGMMFGQWMANPYVILLLVLFFLFMALSMFGFYDINFRFGSAEAPKGGSLVATYGFGLVVGLASSPCLSPILAVLLGFVGSMAEPMSGLALLFCFSMGISMILLAVGFFSGTLGTLPRPGSWMVEIKKALGFFMLFACVYFTAPFMKRYQILLLCSLIFFIAFIYYTFSSRNERILRIIRHDGVTEGLSNNVLGTISVKFVVKTLLSLAALVACGYLAYMGYLSYRKTTTVKLVTKLLMQ